jgi:hypothetical protein
MATQVAPASSETKMSSFPTSGDDDKDVASSSSSLRTSGIKRSPRQIERFIIVISHIGQVLGVRADGTERDDLGLGEPKVVER